MHTRMDLFTLYIIAQKNSVVKSFFVKDNHLLQLAAGYATMRSRREIRKKKERKVRDVREAGAEEAPGPENMETGGVRRQFYGEFLSGVHGRAI